MRTWLGFALLAAGLLATSTVAGCGSSDSSDRSSGASGATGGSGEIGTSSAKKRAIEPGIVVCSGDSQLHLTLTAYGLNSGSVLFKRRFGGPRFQCGNQPIDAQTIAPATYSANGWSDDFTQKVAIVEVPRNGKLPKVVGNGESRVVGKTESPAGFAAASHDPISPAIAPNGDVYWFDDSGRGLSIYRNSERIGDASAVPGVPHFEFKGDDWEVVSADASFGHGSESPARRDPFGIVPGVVYPEELYPRLPKTDLRLGPGFYSPDRSTLYFQAEGDHASLYSASVDGSHPRAVVRNLEPFSIVGFVNPD